LLKTDSLTVSVPFHNVIFSFIQYLYSKRDEPRIGFKLLIRRFKANRRKVLKASLLLSLFGIFGLGGVLAATTITLNQGSPIALGAGYTTSTACDSSITINTQNQFINNKFMISTISLSDIDATYPNGCGSSVLDLSLVVNGSLVNTSFSIASSASNNNYQFGGSAGTGFLANSVLTPFDISQLTSVALSAYKVSVVSYAVGDTGPGGGYIFYVAATPFNCGPTFTSTCTYLETAPSGWNANAETAAGTNPGMKWANDSYASLDVDGITGNGGGVAVTNDASYILSTTALGLGYRNSIAIVNQGNDNTTAAGAARAYTGGGKSDWYLPSSTELNLLCQWARGVAPSVTTRCSGGATLNSSTYGAASAGFLVDIYWPSSEYTAGFAYRQSFSTGATANYVKGHPYYKVRAIRAF
jgi:hypothetical protein